jgi:hypothetical protein
MTVLLLSLVQVTERCVSGINTWQLSSRVIRWDYITNIFFYSKMTSFFRFVNKRAIYRLGIISLAHAPLHVTDFSVVNVHVDELSSARIWQHKLCATLSANVNINCRLPIKVYYHICTLKVGLYSGCDSDATDLRCRFQHCYPIAATTHVIADHR